MKRLICIVMVFLCINVVGGQGYTHQKVVSGVTDAYGYLNENGGWLVNSSGSLYLKTGNPGTFIFPRLSLNQPPGLRSCR